MTAPAAVLSKQAPLPRPPSSTVLLLRDLVHDHTGMYFDEDRLETLLTKLEPLAGDQKCRSFLDYYYLLKLEGEVSGEWQRVVEALSVQETYFWREMDQVRVLVDQLVPEWFSKHKKPLRIWSAACATGDEPYTIAMALQEAGWLAREPIEIIGSDASVTALEKAKRGVYRERAFRSLPPDLREKYFQPVPHGWSIAPQLLVRVRFQRANLVIPEEISQLAEAPIVFCRNVFIYFSHEAIRKTVNTFAERMPPEGTLLVGTTESLLRLTERFDLQERGQAFIYVKNQAKIPPKFVNV